MDCTEAVGCAYKGNYSVDAIQCRQRRWGIIMCAISEILFYKDFADSAHFVLCTVKSWNKIQSASCWCRLTTVASQMHGEYMGEISLNQQIWHRTWSLSNHLCSACTVRCGASTCSVLLNRGYFGFIIVIHYRNFQPDPPHTCVRRLIRNFILRIHHLRVCIVHPLI